MTVAHTPAASVDQALIEDVIAFIRRFVVFQDPNQYDVLALWILHTYAIEGSYATPYIYVKSAEKQSGKTRTIEVAALLAKNAITTASASPGALYAAIASDSKPTLFIDEVDAIFTGAANEDLRGMLNSGYKKNGTVMRQALVEGGERIAVPYSTFCCKLLAGIDNGRIPETIEDRCITFNLKRKKKDEEVERLIERKIEGDVEALRSRIDTWATANMEHILHFEPKIIEEISDRSFEIAEPLLQVASRFRGWTTRSRKAITALLAQRVEKMSPSQEALKAAQNLLGTDRDRITSAELAAALDVSTKKLGVLLAPYEITPGTIRLPGGSTAKGYYRKGFQDAWERYL